MGHLLWNDDDGVIEQLDDLKIFHMVFLFIWINAIDDNNNRD